MPKGEIPANHSAHKCPFCGAALTNGESRCRSKLCQVLIVAGRWIVAHEYSEITVTRNAEVLQLRKILRDRVVIGKRGNGDEEEKAAT